MRHNPDVGIMHSLMQGRPVIVRGGVERSPRRKMDGVGHTIVEGSIGLVMKNRVGGELLICVSSKAISNFFRSC